MTNYEYNKERLENGLASLRIPPHMHNGIKRYVLDGIPIGDFGRMLLSNDLMGCVGRADSENQYAIAEWCKLLYNYVPAGCYGSPEAYSAWLASGGIKGQESEAA